MDHFFTVLGGMGTAATESYLRLLNARTPAAKDQDYLDYLLVNHASVPDRTAYILDHRQPSFLPPLLQDIRQQSQLHPDFFVVVCNTAHYFYQALQAATPIPILHMPHLAVRHLSAQFPTAHRVGLIATQGSIADGVYAKEISATGREVVLGDAALQDAVSELIYTHIKQQGTVDAALYHQILARMQTEFQVDVTVLGCTELSLAQEKAPTHPYPVIDAQSLIVDLSLQLALAFRRDPAAGRALLAQLMAD
ncbi:aspartate/glutamate racemase family protein [Lacticaseibacillus absianus]|uniref:aspartate/glutamate racemase family protein n=1 Tax=Lacticaseibacillus absianus TaxID=2729623 RepID=UPI0015CDC8AC|nr:amino acid racemase [Lacticaseibacillus absianus]